MQFSEEQGRVMENAAVEALFEILRPIYFPNISEVDELEPSMQVLLSDAATQVILAYNDCRVAFIKETLKTAPEKPTVSETIKKKIEEVPADLKVIHADFFAMLGKSFGQDLDPSKEK
jgi:hypothetical protein